MFWRFGYHNASAIDGLLDKPGVTLEELFDEEDLIQECKTKNAKLVSFLERPDNVEKLLNCIASDSARPLGPSPLIPLPTAAVESALESALTTDLESDLEMDLKSSQEPKVADSSTEASTESFPSFSDMASQSELPTPTSVHSEEERRSRYPYLASEILASDISSLWDTLLQSPEMMHSLFAYLDRPAPLDPFRTSHWAKVVAAMLNSRPVQVLDAFRSEDAFLHKLLTHLGTSAICDLLIRLISIDDVLSGAGVVDWLQTEGLVESLVQRLDPHLETDIHATAASTLLEIIAITYAPHPMEIQPPGNPYENAAAPQPQQQPSASGVVLVNELKKGKITEKLIKFMLDDDAPRVSSSTSHIVNIIIELIRRYCTEIEHTEYAHHQSPDLTQRQRVEQFLQLSVDISDLLAALGDHITTFSNLLQTPRRLPSYIDNAAERAIPLGAERLKICELLAELLHLQYLVTSSPLFQNLVHDFEDLEVDSDFSSEERDEMRKSLNLDNTKISIEILRDITKKMHDEKVINICVDLFFQYPWNNFLHSVVYDMIAKVFNTYACCYTSSLLAPDPNGGGNGSRTLADAPDSKSEKLSNDNLRLSESWVITIRDTTRKLVLSIFNDGALIPKICSAQRQNNFEESQPRGVRLGFMGHLTYISDEILKLLEKCGTNDLEIALKEYLESEAWHEYLHAFLRETKERDRQQLGGTRPHGLFTSGNALLANGSFGGDDADMGLGNGPGPIKRGVTDYDQGSDDDDEEFEVDGHELDSESDQLARYLCQQIVTDLPHRLGGDSSDDDEEEMNEEKWLADFGPAFQPRTLPFDIANTMPGEGELLTISNRTLDKFGHSSEPNVPNIQYGGSGATAWSSAGDDLNRSRGAGDTDLLVQVRGGSGLTTEVLTVADWNAAFQKDIVENNMSPGFGQGSHANETFENIERNRDEADFCVEPTTPREIIDSPISSATTDSSSSVFSSTTSESLSPSLITDYSMPKDHDGPATPSSQSETTTVVNYSEDDDDHNEHLESLKDSGTTVGIQKPLGMQSQSIAEQGDAFDVEGLQAALADGDGGDEDGGSKE